MDTSLYIPVPGRFHDLETRDDARPAEMPNGASSAQGPSLDRSAPELPCGQASPILPRQRDFKQLPLVKIVRPFGPVARPRSLARCRALSISRLGLVTTTAATKA